MMWPATYPLRLRQRCQQLQRCAPACSGCRAGIQNPQSRIFPLINVQGCAYAPLVRHFAREGEEQDLLRASVRVGAAQHPYVLHMLDESCVALVHMACARDPAEGSGAGVSGAELAALEAALEERVQPERLAAWRRLQAALANDLRRYAQVC